MKTIRLKKDVMSIVIPYTLLDGKIIGKVTPDSTITPLTNKDFLLESMRMHEYFAKGPEGARRYIEIANVILPADGEFNLEDEPFARLYEAVKKSRWGLGINALCIQYYDEMDRAAKPPRKEKEEPKAKQ